MDSIVKNIGKEYITAVTQCIVALFTHVFEKVYPEFTYIVVLFIPVFNFNPLIGKDALEF